VLLQTFAEELVRLPGCFLCYQPAPDAPPVAPLPAATNGFVTFGSFNNLAKITPQVLALWARILHRWAGMATDAFVLLNGVSQGAMNQFKATADHLMRSS
jgi:predicted O-linked N-acetylglucosamine transferase (SPINDLY family)